MRTFVTLVGVSLVLASTASAQSVRIVSVRRSVGHADVAAVREAVVAATPAIARCARHGAADGSPLTGRVVLALVLTPGAPAQTTLEGAEAPRFTACVSAVLARAAIDPGEAASRFSIRLALPSPAPSPPVPGALDVARAEVEGARAQARCLVRSARLLDRLVARAERARGDRRAALEQQIVAARASIDGCASARALLTAPPVGWGVGPCAICRDGGCTDGVRASSGE